MIDNIDSSSSLLRLLASQALKFWKNEGVIKLLTEDDVIVRTAAARELHLRKEKMIYENVLHLCKDDRAYVREIAAFTLGQLGTPFYPFKTESFPILCELLNDSNYEVRATSASALGHLSYDGMPVEVESSLLLASKDSIADVRACVAYALGNATPSTIVKNVLDKLATDNNELVRSYAELGIELLNSVKERRK